MLELAIGALLGLVLSITLQAYVRPFAAFMERVGRRHFASSPLLVHVERDPSIIWGGEPDWIPLSMYIDDPLRVAQIATEGRDDWVRRARSANAVDARMTYLKVTIQAKVDAAVVIDSVRVVSHRQVELTKGVILVRPTGGADLEPRRVEIDFDWGNDPLVTWLAPGGQPMSVPSMKLAAGDVERFHIWAKANQETAAIWHEWSLELGLLVEGVRQVFRVDENGAPFVTVSPGQLPMRFNAAGTSEWRDTLG